MRLRNMVVAVALAALGMSLWRFGDWFMLPENDAGDSTSAHLMAHSSYGMALMCFAWALRILFRDRTPAPGTARS